MTKTNLRSLAATALLLLLAPASGVAQGARGGPRELPVPHSHPRVRAALEHVARTEAQTIEDQVALCEIPAPPFKEARRAEEYRRRFQALGLRNVRIDAEGNVIGERPGEPGEPTVMISGHLDTVFAEGTDVTVKREGKVLHGPGIADDCRGLAVLLGVARALDQAGVRTRGTILFVGTVGEEGPGNLRGVRHLFQKEMPGRVDYFISVDGGGLDLVRDAVGSNRYRVAYKGPGGHSYGAFGMPNPIHALGRAIAKISELRVPTEPKVTFSVGVIDGGTSVNSIPFEATMEVDMRSVDPAALARLDSAFHRAVREALDEENGRWSSPTRITLEVQSIGVRPAGTQPADAPIVRAGLASAARLGITPAVEASSTDANLPISLGIPSVTMDGGGVEARTHALDESYDPTDSHLGTQWALLYLVTLAGVR